MLLLLLGAEGVDANYRIRIPMDCVWPYGSRTGFERLCFDWKRFVGLAVNVCVPAGGFFCTAFLFLPSWKGKKGLFLLPFGAFAACLLLAWGVDALAAWLWPRPPFGGWISPKPILSVLAAVPALFPFLRPGLRGVRTNRAASLGLGALGLLFVLAYCGSRLFLNSSITPLSPGLRTLWAHNRLFWAENRDLVPLAVGLLPLMGLQCLPLAQGLFPRGAGKGP
ncbi:MAG: hypothetical protein LBD02_04285 [Christensenellaceae bacterium]|jgi:hypothetical protein|nr:hypothetical protein [Christensenellaceae bacterium]